MPMTISVPPTCRGFTLVELLTVVGIIGLLVAILMPTLGSVRQAARASVCLSNLRQISLGWSMYLQESGGRLPYHIWKNSDPAATDEKNAQVAWSGYWIGIVSAYRVPTSRLLCPEASEPVTGRDGFGLSNQAWNGAANVPGTPLWFSEPATTLDPGTSVPKPGLYRTGSYGMNWTLTRSKSSLKYRWPRQVSAIKEATVVPVFFDSVWVDVGLSGEFPVTTFPPDLSGAAALGSDEDAWRLFIRRHDRAINMTFIDGHAERLALTDTLNVQWCPDWKRTVLQYGTSPSQLPSR